MPSNHEPDVCTRHDQELESADEFRLPRRCGRDILAASMNADLKRMKRTPQAKIIRRALGLSSCVPFARRRRDRPGFHPLPPSVPVHEQNQLALGCRHAQPRGRGVDRTVPIVKNQILHLAACH